MGIIPVMMRKSLLAATWGIFLLFSIDHAFAEHFSLSFSKFCQAENVNGAGASTADGPTEPGTDTGTQKAQARSTEDVALSERLQDLIANRLQQYVATARSTPVYFESARTYNPLKLTFTPPHLPLSSTTKYRPTSSSLAAQASDAASSAGGNPD